jgi:hypothetical protein
MGTKCSNRQVPCFVAELKVPTLIIPTAKQCSRRALATRPANKVIDNQSKLMIVEVSIYVSTSIAKMYHPFFYTE